MLLNHNWLVDEAVGGWQISGTLVLSTGNPFTVYATQNTFAQAGSPFPNWSGISPKPANRSINNRYKPIEFAHPRGLLTRRVNNSGDISWHKGRAFISEVFRFEELGFEELEADSYKVFFRDVEIGEFDVEALRFRPGTSMRNNR